MIDPASTSALISGSFGLATIFVVRWWNRRDASAAAELVASGIRAQRAGEEAAAAAKIAAEGAAALLRENARKADESQQLLREIGHNVDGRLSRQTEIAESGAADAAAVRAEMASLKTLFAEVLAARPGALQEARDAIAKPTEPAPVVPAFQSAGPQQK